MKSPANQRTGHKSVAFVLPDTVDEALTRYWKLSAKQGLAHSDTSPDYHGFHCWFFQSFDRLLLSHPAPTHLIAPSPMISARLEQIIQALNDNGIQITTTGFYPIKKCFPAPGKGLKALKALNKAKLLLSLSSEFSNRGLHLLRFLSGLPLGDTTASSITEASSPLEHRAAFFSSIYNRDANQAFKMLGRLKSRDHDPGEIVYLEALASFHSENLDVAIAHASEIPFDAVDYPCARLLIIEAYALKGDVAAFERELSSMVPHFFPPFFLPYVWQIAVKNSNYPEETLEKALRTINSREENSIAGSGVYRALNKQSCDLAVQLVEHRRDQCFRAAALEQAGEQDFNPLTDTPLAARQVAAAVVLDRKLHTTILRLDAEHASMEIVKRLMNSSTPNVDDFVQALLCQWRIGSREYFIQNTLGSVDALLSKCGSNGIHIITLAYREAVIIQHKNAAESLKARLSDLPSESAIPIANIVERQASPMGRFALQAACHHLLAIEQGGNVWSDAGMVSLGFFRILELELNHRVILPLLNSRAAADIQVGVTQLRAVEQSGKVISAIKFWENIAGRVHSAGEKKGMELGLSGIFLSKIRVVSGCDAAIKSSFRSVLISLLSCDGIVAFDNGDLGSLISQQACGNYPPPLAAGRDR